MSIGWTWKLWDAAANSYRANRYNKAREDTERRIGEATCWGGGVVSDLQGLGCEVTKWAATTCSALTGFYFDPKDEALAEIPEDLKDKALKDGYRKREELDREIADLKADRIKYWLSFRWPSALRAGEAIRHAEERRAIELPGDVAGDTSSPLRTPALVGGAVATLGAGLAAYYQGSAPSPSALPEPTPQATAGGGNPIVRN